MSYDHAAGHELEGKPKAVTCVPENWVSKSLWQGKAITPIITACRVRNLLQKNNALESETVEIVACSVDSLDHYCQNNSPYQML